MFYTDDVLVRYLRAAIISTIVFIFSPLTFAEQMSVVQHIMAPGGKVSYYIVSSDRPGSGSSGLTAIVSRENDTNKVLLQEAPNSDPEKNLSGFYNLYLSPDAKELFFNSEAWATAGAVHSLNISTGSVKYITAGDLACVVLSGEYQGNLVVAKHKYFVQGGSHDDLYLVDLKGKEIGLVAQGTDKSGVCPTLGQG
ncbi:hypothetical protein [Citrobacter sp.]|uniref:hypothetical protein n=1 Tax=Citrobacter sp. TaxID=1896336 RepID=UPI003A86F852